MRQASLLLTIALATSPARSATIERDVAPVDLAAADLPRGGIVVAEGMFEPYLLAGALQADALVVVEPDAERRRIHALHAVVLALADRPQRFVELWRGKGFAVLYPAVKERMPPSEERSAILKALYDNRVAVSGALDALASSLVDRSARTFLTDDAQLAHLKALAAAGKITVVAAPPPSASTRFFARPRRLRDGEGTADALIGLGGGDLLVAPGGALEPLLATAGTDAAALRKASTALRPGVFRGPASGVQPPKPEPSKPEPAGAVDGRTTFDFPAAPEIKPCVSDGLVGDMACIPGGPFVRGTDDPADVASTPKGVVWVQTFYMDINEVTVGQYKACVKKMGCRNSGPTYPDFSHPDQPITGISWYDAKYFCEKHGKRLPTEAQWEKAARGTDGRLYPWGDEAATCEKACYMDEKGRSCGIPQKSKQPLKGRPDHVGIRAPNQYGLFDMAGNSWEWVQDWMSGSWAECGKDCEGVDPLGPCGGKEPCRGHKERVVRGGSWYWPAFYMTTFHRRPHIPKNDVIFHHFGFRCAATVEEATLVAPPTAKTVPASP